MVLSQQRGFRFSLSDVSDEKTPNPVRIAATSAAIALHAVALLVLLAPVAAPPVAEEPLIRQPVIFWPEKKIPPPQPPPPIPVDVVKQPPRTNTAVQPPQQNVVEDVPLVSDSGTVAYIEPTDTGTATPNIADSGPVAAVRLEYADAPAPAYPRDAIRERREGVVMLQITVDVDGRPIDVVVAQSSGYRDLDAAARQQVLKRWRFKPAMKDGLAIQAIGMVPVNFTLNR